MRPKGPLPKACDIVYCRWPYGPGGPPPGFKDRPALVRRVLKHKVTAAIRVEVAYGTTNMSRKNRTSYPITLMANMDKVGLHYATRFDLAKTIILPWDTDYFKPIRDGSPIMGSLTDQMKAELEALAKRIEELPQY